MTRTRGERRALWLAILCALAWSYGANRALSSRVANLEARAAWFLPERAP
jgi:hypothetical protein